MTGNKKFVLSVTGIVCAAGLLVAGAFLYQRYFMSTNDIDGDSPSFISGLINYGAQEDEQPEEIGYVAFNSAEDFQQYIKENTQSSYTTPFSTTSVNELSATNDIKLDTALGQSSESSTPSRSSETNVQVMGIDEPDIVKTNGSIIALSGDEYGYYRTFSSYVPPMSEAAKTSLITAFPPENLALANTIEEAGELFLVNNQLIIISSMGISSLDVTDPKNPQAQWRFSFAENTTFHSARLMDNTLYLITRTAVDNGTPCPYSPLKDTAEDIVIDCSSIFHPQTATAVDETLTTMSINTSTGVVEDSVAVVGSNYSSVVYMSPNSLYITHTHSQNMSDVMMAFLLQEGKDLLPGDVMDKIQSLSTYEISAQAKEVELSSIIEQYISTLSKEEQTKMEAEMKSAGATYFDAHKREFDKTIIAKIDPASLDITAEGSVPGTVLNQFAFDEYNDHLRVATTVGERFRFIFNEEDKTVNDLYILDDSLKQSGVVEDLGQGERIYSTRFIGDRGYMVTFRQTDPFYVFDLSDPAHPEKKGELKIPGYSSYLHPIAENRILGVGQEEGQLKISLFDVTDPTNPQEINKYTLDDYTSEVLFDHKAFLHDAKHTAFFIPGGKGGYVFTYKNDTIALEKTINDYSIERAVFIDHYLYMVGHQQVVALDENGWKEVKRLTLQEETTLPQPEPTEVLE